MALLTVAEAATRLRVSKRTALRLIRLHMAYAMVGERRLVVHESSLEDYIRCRTVESTEGKTSKISRYGGRAGKTKQGGGTGSLPDSPIESLPSSGSPNTNEKLLARINLAVQRASVKR